MSASGIHSQTNLLPIPLSTSVRYTDPFIVLERQFRQVQDNLQTLLDAQNAGLSTVLSNISNDDPSTIGSTPTPSHFGIPSGAPTIPIRQPLDKKITLKGARKGILKSIHNLLTLKEEERRIVDFELGNRRDAIRQVDAFVSKQKGLESILSGGQHNQEARRLETLKRDSNALEEQIIELDNRLLAMKARHRRMLDDITQLQNSLDSNLSSYRESLALVRKDSERYLESPPIQPLTASKKSTFYSLPPNRRTLEMAKEHWQNENMELRRRGRNADLEITALREGGKTWHKVLATIGTLEASIHEKIARISSPPDGTNADITISQTIVREMDDTLEQLNSDLQLAEQKNWNLLICGIGAEVEALQQGKFAFMDMLGYHNEQSDQGVNEDEGVPEDFLRVHESPISTAQFNAYEEDHDKHSRKHVRTTSSGSSNEPDEEFLFSKLD